MHYSECQNTEASVLSSPSRMEVLNEESSAPFTDTDAVTSLLKRESRFFVGIERSDIQILTDALEQLDDFLKDADEDSAGEVMRDSVNSWLEETNDEPQVKGYLGVDCVLNLSQLLQERRIVDFLTQAGQTFGRLRSIKRVAFESDSENSEVLSADDEPNLLDLTRFSGFDYDSESSEPSPFEYDPALFGSGHSLVFDSDSEVDDEETNQTEEEEEEETQSSDFGERQSRKVFYSFLEDYIDSEVKGVTERLLEETSTSSLIVLVGPSGIGKTLLAGEVYDSETVRDRFDCCGWINVSSSYNAKEILKDMITQISEEGDGDGDGEELDGMRTLELLSKLRQSLQAKRYMFVFDDVCQEIFWHFIKQGLPDNEKGNKIIVTSPSGTFLDSCQVCSFDHVHSLGPLSDTMSMQLFCATAFHDEPGHLCPPELERYSLEIVRMCKGFPLPIVAVAGLLSSKDVKVSEWERVHHNFIHEFMFNLRPPSAFEALTLSFLELPTHLWSCFLYFSIFPENSLISVDKLFRFWIADGFIEEKRGTTLEEVAEEYLNELVERKMVQRYKSAQGLESFCKVHTLIHQMARVKATELNFCHFHDEFSSSSIKNGRRLSIDNASNASDIIEKSPVRAVFLFNIGALHSSFVVSLKNKCEHLTLFDLENAPIEELPEELGSLSHLKYLCLRYTKVKRLPSSLGKLQNLQTLDVRNTLVRELSQEINKLKKLQHLLAGVSSRGVKITAGIGWLDKLHTLTTVDVSLGGIALVKELARLRKLRRLGISGLTGELGIDLCTSLDVLIHLENLILQAKNGEMLKLQTISTMMTHMKCLVLKGQLPKSPYLIVGLPNLTTLCLSLSKLAEIPLNDLSDLPNLASLWLYRAFEGEKLYFQKGGFERLNLLVLRNLEGLSVVEIEEGALPRLEELRIGSIPLLIEVPSGIEHLKNLKVLANYDMPGEFVRSIQPNCSDYVKVEHISSVVFWYRIEGRNYKMYKLGDSELLDHFLGLSTDADVFVQHPNDFELSFCHSDDEESENNRVDRSSFSSSRSFFRRNNPSQWSFSSGFYTDDVEE